MLNWLPRTGAVCLVSQNLPVNYRQDDSMRQYGVKKYHRDVYFPARLREICESWLRLHAAKYTVSQHAAKQLRERSLVLPRALPLNASIVEATMNCGELEKFLIRFAHNEHEDLVVGIVTGSGLITTVFWNERDDHHRTLNRGQYVRAA